ncbi:hypothetical protein B9Z55_018622 [Caenorhabditis nigoni]|nr:hypothetical protein B9Z55_018622 [Caenorhabditis nigoni]
MDEHSQAKLIMVSAIVEAFKFELMVQVEAAHNVYNNASDVVAKPAPSIPKEGSVFCGAQLQKCRLSIGSIAKMIDKFLDHHQQLIATEDQRQACEQDISRHVEQDGLLAKLKCDSDSLLDMMEQPKASESDMSSGLFGDPGVVTSVAVATSGSQIGYAFRDFLCDGRSEIAPSLENESLKPRSGLTPRALVKETSRRSQIDSYRIG